MHTTWMNLLIEIILIGKSEFQKVTYGVIPFLIDKILEMENRMVVTRD